MTVLRGLVGQSRWKLCPQRLTLMVCILSGVLLSLVSGRGASAAGKGGVGPGPIFGLALSERRFDLWKETLVDLKKLAEEQTKSEKEDDGTQGNPLPGLFDLEVAPPALDDIKSEEGGFGDALKTEDSDSQDATLSWIILIALVAGPVLVALVLFFLKSKTS